MGFRNQPFACDSPAAAVALMIERLQSVPRNRATEQVALARACGRVLAETVCTDRMSPPVSVSAMDGYALVSADVEAAPAGDFSRDVSREVLIGTAPAPIRPREVVRIVTGAAIPLGCDAVIKRESVVEESSSSGCVKRITISQRAREALRGGENIRYAGENAPAGAEVLRRGTRLTPAALGALAAVGCAVPRVFARLRVSIITTGDELVAVDETPAPTQIRNSNGLAIESLLASHPWLDVVSPVHVRDDESALARDLGDAHADSDAIVLTGGVSMGHRDCVRAAIESIAAIAPVEVLFHGLPQQPGKPMLGAIAGGVPIFALPGNPVSSLVTCTRIVRTVLAAHAGMERDAAIARVIVANDDEQRIGLWWHRLVTVNDCGVARLVEGRGSGDMLSAGVSDGFVEIPPKEGAGGPFAFYPWS